MISEGLRVSTFYNWLFRIGNSDHWEIVRWPVKTRHYSLLIDILDNKLEFAEDPNDLGIV